MNESRKAALDEISAIGQELDTELDAERSRMNMWWDSLSLDDKYKSFYSVVQRIVQGDVVENRSYRGVLYETFGFPSDSYGLGMSCGFMTLHNSIVPHTEQSILRAERREAIALIKKYRDVIGDDADKLLNDLKGDAL